MDRHRCTECGSYCTDAKLCRTPLTKFSSVYNKLTNGIFNDEGMSVTVQSRKAKLQSWLTMRGNVSP